MDVHRQGASRTCARLQGDRRVRLAARLQGWGERAEPFAAQADHLMQRSSPKLSTTRALWTGKPVQRREKAGCSSMPGPREQHHRPGTGARRRGARSNSPIRVCRRPARRPARAAPGRWAGTRERAGAGDPRRLLLTEPNAPPFRRIFRTTNFAVRAHSLHTCWGSPLRHRRNPAAGPKSRSRARVASACSRFCSSQSFSNSGGIGIIIHLYRVLRGVVRGPCRRLVGPAHVSYALAANSFARRCGTALDRVGRSPILLLGHARNR